MNQYYIECGVAHSSLCRNDYGREWIKDLLLKQYTFENKQCIYGYTVINGDPIEKEFITIHSVKQGDNIVLVSDGCPRLMETLKKSEEELKTLLEQDPLCIKDYISTKGLQENNISFDERCYIRFSGEKGLEFIKKT